VNNSGCSLLREARTKAQESYLAGVVYSKCRVDLSRYPGPGRYTLFVPLENSTFAVLVICTVDKSSSVFMMLKVSRKWHSWPLQVKINKNRKLQPNLSRLLQTCHCWLLTRRKLWVKSIWRHIQQQFSYPRASQLSYWRSFASDLTDFPYPRSHPQSTWKWS